MTPQFGKASNVNIEGELDRLTYSAYLLTLDAGVAVSVVLSAIDGSLDQISTDPDLLSRTVELALQQVRGQSTSRLDRKSSASEAVLYGDSTAANSKWSLSLRENMSGNPILLLDYSARIAFVLHHVLGYKVAEAAAISQMNEEEYRAQLREAYLQLASVHFGAEVAGHALEEPVSV
jgi:hypothetical protein